MEKIVDFVYDHLSGILVAVAVLAILGGMIIPLFIAVAKEMWAWALA